MKRLCTFLLAMALCSSLCCQHMGQGQGCAAGSLHLLLKEKNRAYKGENVRLEAAYIKNARPGGNAKSAAQYTLPVVVHIIHQNGPENIPDARVEKGIELLNTAFANLGYYDPATGVDTELSFCLAQRDPEGNATNGIVRYQSPVTDMSAPYGHSDLYNLANWDTKEYINIILVREACLSGNCGAAGYATYPPTHGLPGDGIVIEAEYFGTDERDAVVIVHEMGHYLGLRHTFEGGCLNTDCLVQGDRVCDTPPDNTTGFFPCGASHNSCTTDSDDPSSNNPFRSVAMGGMGDQDDMHRNYMDYSAYECYDRFTQGQKERMHFFIENARSSLLDSKGCLPPCPLDLEAFFTLGQDTVEVGEILLANNGSTGADGYVWYINDVMVSSETDLEHPFDEEGEYTVRLVIESNLIECNEDVFETTVTVTCPVTAGFTYTINGGWLVFGEQAVGADNFQWILRDGDGTHLFGSPNPSDSFDISGYEYVQLCLLAGNGLCSDQHCEYILLVADGIEVCNNGLDDDGDGTVDLFDPDCPCNDTAYQAFCPVECEYVPDSIPAVELKVNWTSSVISNSGASGSVPSVSTTGDINGDGTVEVVVAKSIKDISNNLIENNIAILDGKDGNTIFEFSLTPFSAAHTMPVIALADIDIDGDAELFAIRTDSIFCFDHSGLLLWKSGKLKYYGGQINFADFNGDGIPELYVGSEIFNSQNGKKLLSGTEGEGCKYFNVWSPCSRQHTIASDLLPSPGLELAAGNTVYQIEINNIDGTVGNIMTPVIAPPPVQDGFTSVGDIDNDGLLDVVVMCPDSHPSGGGIWVWNPRDLTILSTAAVGSIGGVPFIGDVNNDCVPEIGMTFSSELRMYEYDGTSQLKLLYNLPTTDGSGFTGITMFDFNQDGKQELVYRDETDLQILEGSTGNTLASFPMKSGTGMEYPVISDVDRDGNAEIIIHGYQIGNGEDVRVYCFKSAGAPWAPARPVWNQYGYHVTNVNDDLTIPRHPQNQAVVLEGHENCLQPTCPAPYNTFLAQATYRTQEGCVQFPADGDISITSTIRCVGDSIEICVHVESTDTVFIQGGIPGWCGTFPEHTWSQGEILVLDTFTIRDSVCFRVPRHFLEDSIFVTINDPEHPFPFVDPTSFLECDYTNNTNILIYLPDIPVLNLGPDIVKCGSEVFTLHAGSGFESYLWNDFSFDSIYSTSFEGPHFVEATDVCGNVHTDTVMVTFDHSGDIDLGADVNACPGEEVDVGISGIYESVQWFPSGNVDCDSCADVTISADTSFSLIAVAGNGNCFSADTVEVTIRERAEVLEGQAICEGDTLTYMGSQLTGEGTYEFPLNGCDSFLLLDLAVLQRDSTFLLEEICAGDSVLFNSDWLAESGMYTATSINTDGCDSLVFLDLRVQETIETLDTVLTCEGDSVNLFGQWFNMDTLVSGTFASVAGCDSLQSFQVMVTPLPMVFLDLETCTGDSVRVGSEWLSGEGFYSVVAPAATGCDSLFEIQLSEIPPIERLDTVMVCEGDSVLLFGQWIGEEVLLTETFTGISGCDSLQSFQVLIEPLPHIPLAFDLCAGDSMQVGSEWLSGDGLFSVTVPAASGCDTVFEVTLSGIPNIYRLDTISLCEGDSPFVFGQWMDSDTLVSATFTGLMGCDSVQSFQVLVDGLVLQSASYELCEGDSVLIGGIWLTGFGSFTVNAGSLTGCDTVYQVEITETAPLVVQQSLSLCEGDSVLVGGEWLSGEGQFSVHIDPLAGCDTIYEVNLGEIPATGNLDSLSFCEGDSVLVFGSHVSVPGTYSETFVSVQGCDSTQVFFVETIPLGFLSDSLSLCEGDSVLVNGNWVFNGGIYIDTLDANPCKSIVSTFVQELASPRMVDTVELCPGDSVLVGNQWVRETGEYIEELTAANGCDSIHALKVNAIDGPGPPVASIDCENLEAMLSISAMDQWSLVWSNGDTSRQTVYRDTGAASVALFAEPNCETGFVVQIPALPDTSGLNTPGDQRIQPGQALQLELGLDPSEWQINWSPSDVFSCDTCLSTQLSADRDLTVEITYVHVSGCIYGSSFLVNLQRPDIYIPNVFSPNGDGINDSWEVVPPSGNDSFDEVLVFERWGGQIASWKNIPSIKWDGTFRGRPLNPGVFVYYIRYTDGLGRTIEKKGDVMILK